MAESNLEELFLKHKRKEIEPKQLSFKRFTCNDIPTCMAWYGLGDYEAMKCHFLASSHFGMKYHCLYNGERIFTEGELELLRPLKECPLWKDEIKK